MPALIDSLRRDHANMELLLQILEQEMAVFDRPDRPDFDIIQGILDYFRAYPAQCHHPKEDLLFAKIKARDPEGAAGIIDIEAEHGQAARRLERFARLVDEVVDDQQIAHGVLDAAVREFVEHERRHMQLEERELLPNALASLHAEDWADLDARLADARDPLFSREAEAKYEQLKQRLAIWERENQADRARLSQGR
jgi:hemerythrin-like domain-containing protein